MAVGSIKVAPNQQAKAPAGFQPLPKAYDEIKSLAQPVGSWVYQNVFKKSGAIHPNANFWKEATIGGLKGNFMSALVYDGVGSTVRNVVAVAKHKESVGRAVGNLTADIGWGTAKGAISGIAVTGTTVGLTALGLTAVPALLGAPAMIAGMAVSWGAYKVLDKIDAKQHISQKISDAVTHLIDKNG